ncbi:ABC transporter permease subunit [Lachnospiraceae bacterium 48-33]
MKQLTAFTKKEFMELIRTGKALLLMILFILFGIMNPAIAKLTPWLLETMSEGFAETGFVITEIEVNAMSSWAQFYKNIPIAFIIFLLMFSGILTAEYHKGTLVNMITKGMDRWKIIMSKLIVMISFWTVGYWVCYGITYLYNAWFWDNKVASYLLFSAFCFYLIGIWMISLIVFLSSVFQNNSAVLITAGCGFLIIYLIGFIQKVKKFLPVKLLESADLLSGTKEASEYLYAIVVLMILVICNITIAVVQFNKKNI